MPSAFILAVRGYPAMPQAGQLEHQRYVLSNPLVLGEEPLTFPAPTTDRDRPVSRRSKPSSRTAFIGEQPNPWELLHPQDAMSRHRTEPTISRGVDYIIILSRALAAGPSLERTRQESACCLIPMNEAFPFGSVVTGSSRQKPGDFPRYCRVAPCARWHKPQTTYGSTVISRFVGTGSLLQHPDVLRCQTSSPL